MKYVTTKKSNTYDAIVIGSGISGGWAAKELCEKGLKTIVLSMPIKQKSAQHDLSLRHQEWLKQNFQNVEGITVERTDKPNNK